MKKFSLTLLLGIITATYALANKDIPGIDLKGWNGRDEVNGWRQVDDRGQPPADQEWIFLRGYALDKQKFHEGFPLQMVFETPDKKFKVTVARVEDITPEMIKENKVRFTKVEGNVEDFGDKDQHGVKFVPNGRSSRSPDIEIIEENI